MVNAPYKRGLIHKMYVLYCENKYSSNFAVRIVVYTVILSFVEAVYYSIVCMFFASNVYDVTGKPLSSIEVLQDLVHVSLIISGTLKHTFLVLRRITFMLVFNIIILAAFAGCCTFRAFYYPD